jgi:hypothetical protein
LRVAPPDADALPPAIDLELNGNCSERPPVDDVAQHVATFVRMIEQEWGRDLLFYVRPTGTSGTPHATAWTGNCGMSGSCDGQRMTAGRCGRSTALHTLTASVVGST